MISEFEFRLKIFNKIFTNGDSKKINDILKRVDSELFDNVVNAFDGLTCKRLSISIKMRMLVSLPKVPESINSNEGLCSPVKLFIKFR